MKLARRTIALSGILFLTLSAFGYLAWHAPWSSQETKSGPFTGAIAKVGDNRETLLRLYQRSTQAKHYINAHGFNSRYCFLVDMRLPSGNNRFFVYNLEKDSIEMAGLVAHGSGIGSNSDEPTFSNTPNSLCTSLGKYRIGNAYQGKFGLAYKLYGLDQTNSKAFDRFVVLHGHACVPMQEVSPLTICESWGCPTVAPVFLTQLKSYLDKTEAPMLLWIYY